MLLSEILNEGTKIKGSYIGVNFSEDSVKRIYDFAKSLKIKNLLDPEKYHCTVIYSTVPLPKKFEALGILEDPMIVQPDKLHIFETEDANVLVLKLIAPELNTRHELLMDKYSLKYDFESYIPHLTISYNVGSYKPDKNINLSNLKNLEIIEEYHNQLESGWSEDE